MKANYLDFSKTSAENISFLMQHYWVEVGFVNVDHNHYATGTRDLKVDPYGTWRALRKALAWGKHEVASVRGGYKCDHQKANREDLRAIWEAISHSLVIFYMFDEREFEKERGEEGWQALEQFIDAPDKEWQWSGPMGKPFSFKGARSSLNSTASPGLDHGSIRLESQLYAQNVTETPPRDTQSIHPIPPTYSTTVHRCYIHLRWHVLYVHLIWISQATELNLLLLSTSNVMRSHIFDSTVMRRSSGCRDP